MRAITVQQPVTERPYVSVDPAMRWGQPCVGGSGTPVDIIAGQVWAGDPVAVVAEDHDMSRGQVLVACWHQGAHGSQAWRRRWGWWAANLAAPAMASPGCDYDTIPDPPQREAT